jgi:hypothetical protein
MGTKRDIFDQIPADKKSRGVGVYIHRKNKKIREEEHLENLKTFMGP